MRSSASVPAIGRRYEPQEALGRALKEFRVARGQRQRDVAAAAGLDPASISRIENGHWNPSLANIGRICIALGVPEAELARRAEELGRQ